MPTVSARLPHGPGLSAFLVVLSLGACQADPVITSDTDGGAGSGGQTGSGGVTVPGSGGAAVPGTGGAPNGTGGAPNGTGGTPGSGGRQGMGTGGRSGTGGAASPDGGVPDGGGTGTGGAAGGAPGSLPAGYAVCVPCHGENGTGVAGMGVDIQHPVVDFSTWVIRNGRVHPDFPLAMAKYTVDALSDSQLQGILTYLAARPKPTTGQGLFLDYCANCHGANAAGGVTMRPINTQAMTAFTTNARNGHSAGQFSARRDFMPKWTAAQLSDAEIKLIFMYVDSL